MAAVVLSFNGASSRHKPIVLLCCFFGRRFKALFGLHSIHSSQCLRNPLPITPPPMARVHQLSPTVLHPMGPLHFLPSVATVAGSASQAVFINPAGWCRKLECLLVKPTLIWVPRPVLGKWQGCAVSRRRLLHLDHGLYECMHCSI